MLITSPAAGETWRTGREYTVRWRTFGHGGRVQFQYSLDDGSTWRRGPMPVAVPARAGELRVRFPHDRGLATDTARLRVVDLDRGTVLALSDRFRIDADWHTKRYGARVILVVPRARRPVPPVRIVRPRRIPVAPRPRWQLRRPVKRRTPPAATRPPVRPAARPAEIRQPDRTAKRKQPAQPKAKTPSRVDRGRRRVPPAPPTSKRKTGTTRSTRRRR